MPNILFVCTANQCRSPMAGAVFLNLLDKLGEAGWQVATAGTWATPGRPMSAGAARALRRRGLAVPEHRARPVDEQLLRWSDLVVVMERGHKEALGVEFPDQADKVRLFIGLCGESGDVPDPVGGSDEVYDATLRRLANCLEAAWPSLRALVEGAG